MARSPFRRDALGSVRKLASANQLVVDRTAPIALGLRSVFLFEDRRFSDTALAGRVVTRRGAIATARSIHGGHVHSALTGASGAPATPCLVLSPEDAPTSALTLSALVRFAGTAPIGGTYNALGGGLVSDATGRMPLYVSVAGGTFRTHVPADNAFLSGGQPLLASSLSGWHRLTVTVSGSTATLTVDGGRTWIGTATQAFANFSLHALLGSDVSAGTEWTWPTADLFYWSRALSSDEVAAHARQPYGALRPRLADRWVAAVLPVTAAPATGNPWDDVFSDEFGPSPPFTATMFLPGAGAFSASAGVTYAATAQIDGAGFSHINGQVLRPGSATLGASGTLAATADASRAGLQQGSATLDGVGGLTATARQLRAASATIGGAGAIAASGNIRYSTRTAQQGAGSLSADATWLGFKGRGSATVAAVGSLTATANTQAYTGQRARLSGSGALIATGMIRQAPHARINGYGHLSAKARVRKRPRMRPGMANGVAPELIALEIETYIPGSVPVMVTFGHGTRAHGTLSRTPPSQLEKTGLIRASDIGYRTAPSDQGGPISYPPLLNDAYQIDVALALEPDKTSAAAAWGSILLANPNAQFDTIAAVQNSDGRAVTILKGAKAWDSGRQYFTDPRYGSLTPFFSALAAPWSLTDEGLQIPLRDVSYFLEKPLQGDYYGGTGDLDGTPDLAGKPKPMARGGSPGQPIQNITPTLVDPVQLIYQYSDGPGQIIALYEGAATGTGAITWAGETTNLYLGTTPIGQYRTDNSRGLFQLGSPPVYPITAAVVGLFPLAGLITHPFQICQFLLSEDARLPASMIDAASFTNLQVAHPSYVGGLYFGSDEQWSCIQAIDSALASFGANLIPTRDGRLRLTLLRAIADTEPVVATYDETRIVAITHRPLPQTLDPPPYRFRVGFNHNFTVMTSGVNSSLATPNRQQFVASPDRYATWYDPTLLAAYRRPNDFTALPGSILSQSNAQEIANALGALWGVKRRLYDVTLPRSLFGCEIGDVVQLRYPIEQLTTGKNGRVVGYSLRATDAAVVYTVLV